MDKDKVLSIMPEVALDQVVDPDRGFRVQLGRLSMEHLLAVATAQRDTDFAVLEQVAQAVAKIDRTRAYAGRGVCTGCCTYEGQPHAADCSWLKLKALGIVEKA